MVSKTWLHFDRPRVVWGAAFLLLFLLVAPAYWKALHNPLAGTYHDDGIYLVTGKALAAGDGYRIVSLPSALAQTKYPPFYPLLLSLVWVVMPHFPQNLTALLSVSLAASVAWMFVIYLVARQEDLPRLFAFLVIALTATSVWVLGLSTTALSETTFAALCTGSLFLLQYEGCSSTKSAAIFAGLLAGFAFLTRSIGIAVLIAGLAWLLRNRRWRDALLFGAVAGLLCSGWIAWGAAHHDPTGSEAYYSAASYKANSVFSTLFVPAQKARIVGMNLLYLLCTPVWLANVTPSKPLLTLMTGLACAAIFLRGMFKRFSLLSMFLLIYLVALVSVCGGLGPRYVVPIFPLITICAAQGLNLNKRRLAIPLLLVSAAVLCHSVGRIYGAATRAAEGHKAWASNGDQDRDELFKMITWIQANTDHRATLASNIDPLFYLYTGRKAIRSFVPNFYDMFYVWNAQRRNPAGTVSDLRRDLKTDGVNYLVITADSDYMEAPYLHSIEYDLIRTCPSAFRLVYEGRTRAYRVFAVNPAKL